MKRIYLLSIFTSVLTMLSLTSCGEDQDMKISDKEKDNIPGDVQLLEYSSNSISVAWDLVEGATSYTVQLLEDIESNNPIHFYTTSNEDYYVFNKLDPYTSYYARVRANFPYSATSDWVYIMNDAQEARIIPKFGVVDQDYVLETVKLINSSTSTLTLTWSFPHYDKAASNYNNDYEIALYEDEACQNLVVSWNLTDNKSSKIFTAPDVTSESPRLLRFTFTGLNPGKTYYFKAKDLTLEQESYAYQCSTKPALAPAVATPSNKGDVIISQDFANFIHGGDILYKAAGYSIAERAEWVKASGANPVNEEIGLIVYNQNTEFNVFDGGKVTTAYTEAAGMKGWGKSGNTSTRPGYIKIGGSKGAATLYTPELNLATSNTVTIKFKAAMYMENTSSYCEDIVVQSVEGAKFSAKGAISNEKDINITNEEIVSIVDAEGDFVEYKIVLKNVTPKSRIAFGSNKNKIDSNKTRFLLDDIIIELGEN